MENIFLQDDDPLFKFSKIHKIYLLTQTSEDQMKRWKKNGIVCVEWSCDYTYIAKCGLSEVIHA